MNYKSIYFDFISSFKKQEIPNGVYFERHHILPRYAGGGNDESNLVKVTYRQHVFLHRVLYAWLKNPQDACALRLMTKQDANRRLEICSMAGKLGGQANIKSGHISRLGKKYGVQNGLKNVASGRLDQIRHLANNDVQREKVRRLGLKNKESGHLENIRHLAHQANRDKVWSESERNRVKQQTLKRMESPEYMDFLHQMSLKSAKLKIEESFKRSEEILSRTDLRLEYLHKTPKRKSKYIFKTPTGLEFESPHNMAMYFKEEDRKSMLEVWCSNNKNGWSKELKPV